MERERQKDEFPLINYPFAFSPKQNGALQAVEPAGFCPL
jgi:hypothetical protein